MTFAPYSRVMRSTVATAVLLVGVASSAQPSVSGEVASRPAGENSGADLFQLRVGYGAGIRSGDERGAGPAVSWSGTAPNDVSLSGWGWFLLSRHLGLRATFGYESFGLYEQEQRVTGGALTSASIAPAGRLLLGPARLELAVGYAFDQMPTFGVGEAPVMTTSNRHGVLLAARGVVALGPVDVEARVEAPFVLASTMGTDASRLSAGGAARVRLVRTGALDWGLLVQGLWSRDSAAGEGYSASQQVVHVGGAVDLKWREAPRARVQPSSLGVTVRGADGQPLAGAVVRVAAPGAPTEMVTDAAGAVAAEGLEAGPVTASASAPGYLPGEARGELRPGHREALVIDLRPEPPKPGALRLVVVSRDGAAPVVAQVRWSGGEQATDAQGALRLEGLAPGPVAVTVTAPGYLPGEEAVAIVAGQTSELAVQLTPEKKALPATIKGVVRSRRGGKPVKAQLEIREAHLRLTADEQGQFSAELAGGQYTVRISAPGFITQTKRVRVPAGDQVIFNVELFPK